MRKSRLSTPVQNDDYTNKSFYTVEKKDPLLRPLLMSDTFTTPKTQGDNLKLFSPVKNARGEYHCFKDVDYDNWFSSKLRKMKDVNILK